MPRREAARHGPACSLRCARRGPARRRLAPDVGAPTASLAGLDSYRFAQVSVTIGARFALAPFSGWRSANRGGFRADGGLLRTRGWVLRHKALVHHADEELRAAKPQRGARSNRCSRARFKLTQ